MAENSRRCLIIPAAGLGTRFAKRGYKQPKPLIEVFGVPMIELVVRNLRTIVGSCRIIVVLRDTMNVETPTIDGVEFIHVPSITQGAANTVLYALQLIEDDVEIIVANSDQLVELNRDVFQQQCDSDGTIVTFLCSERNPKWSYAEVDSGGRLVCVAEKVAISEHATVGVYRYATAKLLKNSINNMITANDRTNGEFYLCPAYNHMPKDTYVTIVDASRMWGLGTPEDLEIALLDPNFTAYVKSLY